MKLASIISEGLASAAQAAEALSALGFQCRSVTSQSYLESPAQPKSDLLYLCDCDAAQTDQLLLAMLMQQPGSLVPVLASPPRQALDDTVHLVASAIVSDTNWKQAIERVTKEASLAKQSGVRCDVRLRMPNSCKFIDALNSQLQTLYRHFGVDTESEHRLTTAVREMAHNAVEWGNRNVAGAAVLLRCTIDTHAVTIYICDSGPGFDRNELPHAATSQDPTRHLHVRDELGLRAGGFGILMTRGLVDELNYNEDGNEVRIVKYFERR